MLNDATGARGLALVRGYAIAVGVFVLLTIPAFLATVRTDRRFPFALPRVPERDGTLRPAGPGHAPVEAVRVGRGAWLAAGGTRARRALDVALGGTPVEVRAGSETSSGAVALVPAPQDRVVGRSVQMALAVTLAAAGLCAAFGALDLRALLAAGLLSGIGALFLDEERSILLARSAPVALATLGAHRLASGFPGLACLVSFFSIFPWDVSSSRRARVGTRTTLALAALVVVLQLVPLLPVLDRAPLRLQAALLRGAVTAELLAYGVATLVTFGLVALQVRAYRAGHVGSRDDRRRAELVGASLAAGFGPTFIVVLAQAAWQFATGRHLFSYLFMSLSFLPFFLVPPALAYAVLAPRVAPVGLLVRRAVLYAFAEKTLRVLGLVPLAVLALYLHAHRRERLDELASVRPAFLGALVLVGLAALRYGSRLRSRLDRLFFREPQDARRILQDLAERSRRAGDSAELAALLVDELDAAFHLESVALLVRDPGRGELSVPVSGVRSHPSASAEVTLGAGNAPRVLLPRRPPKPLDAASTLATVAAASHEPLDVDLGPSGPLSRLPGAERDWLRASGASLLVPLTASDGTLLGLLTLGGKQSELPFDAEDRLLLSAVAASAALALENRLLRSSTGHGASSRALLAAAEEAPDGDLHLARSCPVCGRLYAPGTETCAKEGSALRLGAVPHVLPGKLRFERLLGSGGMGVVYLARDLTLGRSVAVKTLPRLTPEIAARMRREARFAASLLHPNLATIFSAETWRGTPMLVFEYLDGGTLADRIGPQPLSPHDVARWGVSLARGLSAAHAAGVLHRDIKPTNVGFTAAGTPKLLDFGLARILDDSRRELAGLSGDAESHPQRLTVSDKIVGTPPYLSPEAAVGADPDPGFDLWGLAVTLYEALAGANPFVARTLGETLENIVTTTPPPLHTVRKDCPPQLSRILEEALARDRARRPRSADELASRLAAVVGVP